MGIRLASAFAAVVLSFTALSAYAATGREYPIGTIAYEAQPQREIITLRRGEGQLRGVRLEVRQKDVELLDMRVTYDDGTTEVVRINQLVRAGGTTRVFEIDSRRREVRSVAVSFLPDGQARITLFGVAGVPAPAPADWSLLGCKDVKFLVDRDTVKVNREGRFAALRIKVRKAPVEMFNLRVTYLSGVKQEVPVREVIIPGGVTRPVELLGRERGIERIEMIYRSLPTNKGTAEVCIDGLER